MFVTGKISIALSGGFMFPKDPNNPEHVIAAERANQFIVSYITIYGVVEEWSTERGITTIRGSM